MQYVLFIALVSGLFIACGDDDNDMEEDLVQQQINEVREITAEFADLNAAIEAGWDTDISGCVEHPTEGGMGHHYARMEFMDGRVNHMEPQVLLYVLNEDREMEFTGVEYIVPFSILSSDEEPPVLFAQEFHANQQLGFWALHVWTERENDEGMFSDWNPAVNCDDWINALIDEVREETVAYRDHDLAVADGWSTDLSGCVEHPTDGGMGHHFARVEWMDDEVHHLQPEVLLYVPDANGDMEFLGVEYIIPFSERSADEDPPILFNQAFHANPDQEIWALHVWTERENSNGVFSDWNPDVSCQ